MIEYEVTLDVDTAIESEYVAWLYEHIEQMLALPGFIDASTSRIVEPVTSGRTGFCVRYRLQDGASLASYFEHHAASMRAQGVERFGNRFRAQRRVLSPLDSTSAAVRQQTSGPVGVPKT